MQRGLPRLLDRDIAATACVDVEAELGEERDRGGATSGGRPHDQRGALATGRFDDIGMGNAEAFDRGAIGRERGTDERVDRLRGRRGCTTGLEVRDELGVAVQRRRLARRATVGKARVNVGTVIDEQLHTRGHVVNDRPLELPLHQLGG